MNINNVIFTYMDKNREGVKKYSYIIKRETTTNVYYESSMPLYESFEEARIAATLLMEHNHLGERV